MLDIWREVYVFSAEDGLPTLLPHQVHPSQLYVLETNVYAHELASVVGWIGYPRADIGLRHRHTRQHPPQNLIELLLCSSLTLHLFILIAPVSMRDRDDHSE